MNTARKHYYGKYLRVGLIFADWVVYNLVFALNLLLYQDVFPTIFSNIGLWVLLNISFIPVLISKVNASDAYRAIRLDTVLLSAMRTVGVHALTFMSLCTLAAFSFIPVPLYLTYYGALFVVEAVWVVFFIISIKHYRTRGYNYLQVVIIGTGNMARRIYEAMISDRGYGYRVVGFFDTNWKPDFLGKYCGNIIDLPDFVKEHKVDQIFFALPGDNDLLAQVVKIADDNVIDFFYVPQISQYISRGFQIEAVANMPVLSIRRNPLRKAINRFIKRSFDMVFSGAFLCVYPFIYAPIAIAIKLTSPGPVYFKQLRTGYHGKDFQCLKFRTMHVNVDADKVQATRDDPRKTRLGDFLRRTSIDELPQFINVFKGDMSVVGPRPHMLKHTEDYTKLVDKYMVRHLVKPGITGWAQVNGYRGTTDELWKMEKRVQFDVWYIEHWSFLLDLKIIARTIVNTFRHDQNAV